MRRKRWWRGRKGDGRYWGVYRESEGQAVPVRGVLDPSWACTARDGDSVVKVVVENNENQHSHKKAPYLPRILLLFPAVSFCYERITHTLAPFPDSRRGIVTTLYLTLVDIVSFILLTAAAVHHYEL